jgi:hypothetical protein
MLKWERWLESHVIQPGKQPDNVVELIRHA